MNEILKLEQEISELLMEQLIEKKENLIREKAFEVAGLKLETEEDFKSLYALRTPSGIEEYYFVNPETNEKKLIIAIFDFNYNFNWCEEENRMKVSIHIQYK